MYLSRPAANGWWRLSKQLHKRSAHALGIRASDLAPRSRERVILGANEVAGLDDADAHQLFQRFVQLGVDFPQRPLVAAPLVQVFQADAVLLPAFVAGDVAASTWPTRRVFGAGSDFASRSSQTPGGRKS